jgi:nitrite reductase/ring-hydroxylating ferredoxin subunit
MGPVTAQLLDELGYDPDDGLPDLSELGDLAGLDGRLGDLVSIADLALGPALAAGAVVAARAGSRRVAVARLGSGRLVVVDDECPHDGGRISDGFVDGDHLICARHGWQLEARNGRCERACKLR